MRRLGPEQLERMIAMRESGAPYSKIAAALGCSQGAVRWHCLRLAVEPPKGTRPWDRLKGPPVVRRGSHLVRRFTPEEDARLLALEAQGLNNNAIARRLGRRWNSVRGRLMTLARRDELLEAS